MHGIGYHVRKSIVVVAGMLVFWTALVWAAAIPAHAGQSPLIVLREASSTSGSIWSGPATFVLYNDGRVVYVHPGQSPGSGVTQYDTAMLSSQDVAALLKSLPLASFNALQTYYGSLSEASPQCMISVWNNGQVKSVAVDADMRALPSGAPRAQLASTSKSVSATPPAAFKAIYLALASYQCENAVSWQPSEVEAILTPMDSPKKCTAWPASWTDFDMPAPLLAGRQSYVSVYHVQLASEQAQRLALLCTNPRQGLMIAHRKWNVALREHLPGEEQWLGTLW